MDEYYLFPFGKVKQGTRIILYGAGKVGQWYLAQLRDTAFAEVVAMTDRLWQQYPQRGVRMVSPNEVGEISCEVIVIAVEKAETAEEIKHSLINSCHIPAKKIVWGCEQEAVKPTVCRPLPPGIMINELAPFAFLRAECSLAALLSGGLGDDIISKRFLEALREFESSLTIDLYCGSHTRGYAEAIYQEPWYQIYDLPALYEWNKEKYDIALKADYILRIDHVKKDGLREKAPRLSAMVENLQDSVEDYGLNAEPLCEYSIHLARSQYRGLNAYAAIGHGLLDYQDDYVNIPIQESAKDNFLALGMPQLYITLNYGWGTKELRKVLPAKVWPLPYHSELVRKLHSEFSEVKLVQLGNPGSVRIKGIDYFVQGESLETVKIVLKHSCLHIDYEGGLVHLATQLGTKCAVLFGPTPKSYFGYKENINICAEVC